MKLGNGGNEENARKRKRRIKKNRIVINKQKPKQLRGVSKKNMECRKIIDLKVCEFCKKRDKDEEIVLCDQCDDAYHWFCMNQRSSEFPKTEELWLCPHCKENQQKHKNLNENENEEEIGSSQTCEKCQENLVKNQDKIESEAEKILAQLYDQSPLKCLVCKKWFHYACFSKRQSSLNCQNCELKIRKMGPKSHIQFVNYLKKQKKIIEESNLIQLTKKEKNEKQRKRASQFYLKLFNELTDWDLIVRYEASLYYALKTKQLTFSDEQLYVNKEMMELNDSMQEIIEVSELCLQDQMVFREFKKKIKKGAVGPYEIKEDRKKGFYVEVTDYIQRGTIISEYTGQVSRHRDSLNKVENDSIFTLLLTGSSQKDLNITPNKFGNMSRFISGINNSSQTSRKANIKALRFSYQGNMRLIFISKRDILKGQTLYLDYNAGTYQEYPTSNFVN